ncbi:MAG: dockerin type I domain-containing protein [Usitatibacteraceae bacterium]
MKHLPRIDLNAPACPRASRSPDVELAKPRPALLLLASALTLCALSAQALTLTGVQSRKTHLGGTGTFDLPVDTTQNVAGPITVEPRVAGSGHLVVFQFDGPVASSGNVSVIEDGLTVLAGANAVASGNEVAVALATIADNKRITVALSNVNNAGVNASASLAFMVGEINGSGAVNSSDISGVKARSGQVTNSSNFKFDVNLSGSVNSSDISAIKARSGTTLVAATGEVTAMLGAAGGAVSGPDGVQLVVPADSLGSNVTLRIARDATGAPPLEGLNAISPVYAGTRHGQTFGATALLSIPLSAAQVPAGATPMLLKAEPGGQWRVMPNGSTDPARLAADIGDLSFFVIGTCTSATGGTGWIIGAANCPSNHELRMTMFDGLTPVQVLRGPNGVQLPLWNVVDTVQTRTFTVTWTRPAGTTRTDSIGIIGLPAEASVNPRPPSVQDTATNFSTTFTMTIDPSRVTGASQPNGRLFRPLASAQYTTTALLVGTGNVPTEFIFEVDIPILVRHTGTQPVITQQPTPANVSVVEGTSFSLTAAATGPNISYQWRYYVDVNDTMVRVAEGINDQPTYTSPLAPLTYSGRLYYAHICSNRGVSGQERCITTQASLLTVTQFTQVAAFTSHPLSRDIIEGAGVSFSAAVTGTPPPVLQWHYAVSCSIRPIVGRVCSGTPFANGAGAGPLTGATISGADTAALSLAGVPLSANGTAIALLATQASLGVNVFGEIATLTVRSAQSVPSISQQPTGSAINEDTQATLTVAYGGTGPLTLTMQRFTAGVWTDVSSTTSSACASPCAILTPSLPLADNGAMFRVHVSNASGGIDSNSVTITVNISRAPIFTSQPAAASVDPDLTTAAGRATFGFGIAGESGVLSWQWLLNGQPLTDGSGVAGNGVLQQSTVSGANGTLSIGTPSTLTVSNVPVLANGAQLSVRVTRTDGGQTRSATSRAATLTLNVTVPVDALTATQIVAGQDWSMVLRPDRTVWAWGLMHRTDGTVQYSNLNAVDEAHRPVRMYPTVLSDVRAISGWFNAFWALKGEPGSIGSRVLHWGKADAGSDGRGGDGNGSLGSSSATRYNEATPVEVLERVNNVPQPVDRVCAIAGGGEQLAIIRAINSAGQTTDCNAGSAKTVWFVGSLLGRGYESTGVAFAMPGLPADSPPAALFTGKTTSGSPPLVIALEDGRIYGLGANPYGGLGVAAVGSGIAGGLSGPVPLPASWGNARGFGMSFYYSLFVVRADGPVVTSGYDINGELGLGSAIGGSTLGPLPVLGETCASLPCADALTGVTAVASNTVLATLALKNGQILGWGKRASGLLGSNTSGNQPFPRPVPSPGLGGFTALSTSNAHALVIGPGNVVYAWGNNASFALGGTQNQTEPTMVTVP